MELQDAFVYLENGAYFKAKSFGASGSSVGELVFNTSLVGYQEIITDPSYAGQFICFTMPEIGIVGVNSQDMESSQAFCKGILCRNYNDFFSNFRAEQSLGAFLQSQNVMGITAIDTRQLTKMIRQEGAMMMVASSIHSSKEALSDLLKRSPKIADIDYTQVVSTKKSYLHTKGHYDFSIMDYSEPKTTRKIIAIDFGIKKGILCQLVSAGFCVEVIPASFCARELIDRYQRREFAGIFLSNGPGDPSILKEPIQAIKELIDAKIPIFAICLGHQLLSIAHGYETYKLKFGHHGGNHPVQNTATQKIEITAQNHNYSVPEEIAQIAKITHKNLFDGTIEGLLYKDSPICSFQHHPEASPGPLESTMLFAEFEKLL